VTIPDQRPIRSHPAHPPPIPHHNEPIVVFVTACAKRRGSLFDNVPAQTALVDSWRLATQWKVGAYLLMPDHIHLFCVPGVLEPEPIAQWAGYWKRLASRADPALRGEWLRDVWDTQMRSRRHYDEKWAYVQMNPVRAGLRSRADEWPYRGSVWPDEW